MNFSDLIKARESIRGFQNKAVPQALIDDIIEVAKWAPSGSMRGEKLEHRLVEGGRIFSCTDIVWLLQIK